MSLEKLFGNQSIYIKSVKKWHSQQNNLYENELRDVSEELLFHSELKDEIKASLLTDKEFLLTYPIRKKGLGSLPDDWVNQQTGETEDELLDDIWLKPKKGHLAKIFGEKGDSFAEKRGFYLPESKRKKIR